MKTSFLTALAMVSSFFIVHSAFGQGSLTPSAPPGPTMVTLSQVQPRTPISSAPYTITQPGSYYLTTNITISSGAAIQIAANNVTLDLNGFTLSSTQTPAVNSLGIWLTTGTTTVTNITIVNGFISGGVTNSSSGTFGGSGFGYGIYAPGSPVNVTVSGVTVSGCLLEGIYLGANNSCVVKNCIVNVAGSYGIYAGLVSDSIAQNCGTVAIFAATTAENCYGYAVGGGSAVDAINAYNCSGIATGNGNGVYATGGVAENCYGYSSGSGVGVSGVTVLNCYGITTSSSYGAIYADTANDCQGYANGSGDGMFIVYAANNCFGFSAGNGDGIWSDNNATFENSQGISSGSGIGVLTTIAIGCIGGTSTGTGINAYIGNSSYGYATGGGTGESISLKYNMP